MRLILKVVGCCVVAAAVLGGSVQAQQSWPTKDGVTVLKDFKFGSGETLPELKLHYLTLGTLHRDAAGHVDNAILMLHGTGYDAHAFLMPIFSNLLFAKGAALDIEKYFLIFPDDIGHGESAKPSDGLRMRFPKYSYDDMVRSQKLMLDAMGVDHLRLILGTSMGCMESFVWGETYPDAMDGLATLACLPEPISGRNRMMRHLIVEAIKSDSAWKGGEYAEEPKLALHHAMELWMVMSSSAQQMQKAAPTREAADKWVEEYIARRMAGSDANDVIYYTDASRDFDASQKLEAIKAPVLWINTADDFINPPELGIAEKSAKRMAKCKFVLLPRTDQTRGHGTYMFSGVWKDYLAEFMKSTERNSGA